MEMFLNANTITYVGLLVLAAGWLVQFFSMSKKKKNVSPWFVFVYTIGVLLLILGAYFSDLFYLAALNLVSALTALLVLVRLR